MTYTRATIMKRAERRAQVVAKAMQRSWGINYRQCLEVAKSDPMYRIAQSLSKKEAER